MAHLAAGPQDMPGVPAEAYKAVIMGEQVVSKSRQGSEAANRVQVVAMPPCW